MLKKEYRYLVIIQVEKNGKIYSFSNKKPITDIQKAKEKAIKNIKIKLQKDDSIILRGFKYVWADVPVISPITGIEYKFQCIACESLTENELKSL